MRIFPVFLDSCPAFLREEGRTGSLLLAPLGNSTVVDFLSSQLASGGRAPAVLSTFEPPPGYEAAIREACPAVDVVIPAGEFAQRLACHEPSDGLLLVDPRLFPAEGLTPEALLRRPVHDHRWVRHLMALPRSEGGTRECVEFDPDGRVRRIQRYYDDVTWPFAAGVCCSLVPGACAALAADLPFTSLADLRRNLSSRGVPSRDLPVQGPVYDLTDEQGLLAISEHFIRKHSAPAFARPVGRGCRIHPSSRLVGPVLLHDGAVVEEDATIVGPSLIGAGSVIGANAVVAQCVVGAGTMVGRDVIVRHRALFGRVAESAVPALPQSAAYRGSVSGSVVPLARPENTPAPDSYLAVKCVVEALIALAALIVLSPLLLVIAVLIAFESRGGAFYADERESKGGRPFRCLKFRTMLAGAEALQRRLYAENQVDGPQFKLDDDPRVTKVGRWLRSVSLDELPQLVNVVRGEMSLVGPRPSPFRENQMCVPWRVGRLSVRPGITGLWQVCRHDRKAGDFHQWIYYDLLYVRHISPVLDLKILLATVLTLGGRRPAPLSWMVNTQDPTGRT